MLGTLAAGRVFDPRRIANLRAWWDAADSASITTVSGAVSSWADKSGNGITASQSTASQRPTTATINSLPALQFASASSNNLTHSIGGSTNWTAIAAVRPTSTPSAFVGITAATSGNTGFMLLLQANDGTKWGTYTSVSRAANTSLSTNTNYILTLVDNGSSGGSFFSNGAADGTFAGDSVGQTTQHIGGLSGQYFNGYMYELLIYTRALSTAERLAVERYLGAKWRIGVA